MFTFSGAHSHALTNATRRHKYFRGLSRLLPVPGVLVSFLELQFLGKMPLLALRGRPQPIKKPSQSQKGHVYVKMNALNDTKTSELSKSVEGNGEYLWSSVEFVEAWIKSKSRNANTGLKTTQMLHKNKACDKSHRAHRSALSFWPARPSVGVNFLIAYTISRNNSAKWMHRGGGGCGRAVMESHHL